MWGIHRWPVNSPHKGPVTQKMFPFWWRHHVFLTLYFSVCCGGRASPPFEGMMTSWRWCFPRNWPLWGKSPRKMPLMGSCYIFLVDSLNYVDFKGHFCWSTGCFDPKCKSCPQYWDCHSCPSGFFLGDNNGHDYCYGKLAIIMAEVTKAPFVNLSDTGNFNFTKL